MDDKENRAASYWGRWTALLLGLLLLYPLSMGPMAQLAIRTRTTPLFDAVYQPVWRIGFAWPAFENVTIWYLSLFD